MDGSALGPRVVVGVDGSPSSWEALRWALRHAELTGATVDAVTAWDVPQGWFVPSVDADVDLESARQRQLRELRDALGDEAAASVRVRLVRGNPTDVLLSAAKGAQALVVGSRGRGGVARALLGSVSLEVAHHATCPVVIVRPPSS
ncbi:universal stress protein [Streptomyces caeni]|uniref:Universal stress protein n=1 Tax=Streptomyces caeni TaxID=2307231 RepID=A0ABW4IXL1_9ACTN